MITLHDNFDDAKYVDQMMNFGSLNGYLPCMITGFNCALLSCNCCDLLHKTCRAREVAQVHCLISLSKGPDQKKNVELQHQSMRPAGH